LLCLRASNTSERTSDQPLPPRACEQGISGARGNDSAANTVGVMSRLRPGSTSSRPAATRKAAQATRTDIFGNNEGWLRSPGWSKSPTAHKSSGPCYPTVETLGAGLKTPGLFYGPGRSNGALSPRSIGRLRRATSSRLSDGQAPAVLITSGARPPRKLGLRPRRMSHPNGLVGSDPLVHAGPALFRHRERLFYVYRRGRFSRCADIGPVRGQ